MKTLAVLTSLVLAVVSASAADGLFFRDGRGIETAVESETLVTRARLRRIETPKALRVELEDSAEPSVTRTYALTVYLEKEFDSAGAGFPVVVLGSMVFMDQVVVSTAGQRPPFLRIERIDDTMNPSQLLERARRLFGLAAGLQPPPSVGLPSEESLSRVAVALANQEAKRLYAVEPFKLDHGSLRAKGDGWVWQALTSSGQEDLLAAVTFAVDGSAVSAEVQMFSHPRDPFPQPSPTTGEDSLPSSRQKPLGPPEIMPR